MREIKFRAWDRSKKILSKPFHIQELGNGQMLYGDLELMQYTGLKDKNCKDIFENDFIRVYDWDSINHCEKLSTFNTKVIFQNGCFGFRSDITHSFMPFTACNRPGTTFEVIGNIYTNSEQKV
jgi:uncharacterized phage protein (TIGR01671 family)